MNNSGQLSQSNHANLISNVDGKIKVIILHNGDMSYRLGFWFDMTLLFKELLEKMDNDVGFVILVTKDHRGKKVRDELKSYENRKLPDGTPRVKYLDVDTKTSRFYPWARDAYTIQTDKDNHLIFLDSGFNEKPFPIINWADVFKKAIPVAATIHRGGGNIRTTDEDIFVGMDTILGITTRPNGFNVESKTPANLFLQAKALKPKQLPVYREIFEAHCRLIHRILAPDKKMIIPGKKIFFKKVAEKKFNFTATQVRDTGAQAAYHTDVYLGLGHKANDGKRVLFVADTKPAVRIVEKLSPKERRHIERSFPAMLAKENFSTTGVILTEKQIAERFRWDKFKLLDACLKKAKKTVEMLDETAKYLKSIGYQIVRVPYLPNGLDNKDENNDGMWGIGFNYSNVLTEVYGKVKKVYMPVYGFKKLDTAASNAYKRAGFNVVPITNLITNSITTRNAFAGLDCLTSDIRIPVTWAEL